MVFSLRVEREAALPPPPFVLAINHYSHFDPPVVGATLGTPVRFLAVEDLLTSNQLFGKLLGRFGAIPTPRGRVPVSTVRTALAALDAGEAVGVFPEATRVSHWGTLQPKRGAAWLAIRANVPLVPVAVIGTGRTLGLDNRIHRAPIRVVYGSPIEPNGADSYQLTNRWSEWMKEQIERAPGSEVDGPRRAHHPDA